MDEELSFPANIPGPRDEQRWRAQCPACEFIFESADRLDRAINILSQDIGINLVRAADRISPRR